MVAWTTGVTAPQPPAETVVESLRALIGTGVEVLYSSDLVPEDLRNPPGLNGLLPLARVSAALAGHHLQLRRIAERRYLVVRAPPAPLPAPAAVAAGTVLASAAPQPDAAIEEVAVFASRYAYDNVGTDSMAMDRQVVETMPGARSDAMRALRAAPGLATNLSARPFIRGALLNDVMVRFDDIEFVDPYHFKNFQSLLSVFDPFAVGRLEAYTGGFPAKYGSRSAGIIDLTPRVADSGADVLVGNDRLGTEVATSGRAMRWPGEWLAALRRSSDSGVLRPVEGESSDPVFLDGLGRVSWAVGAASALTVGWLALDDVVQASSDSKDEHASAHSRDVSGWVRWDYAPWTSLYAHTSLAITEAQRNRSGSVNQPGIAIGNLAERRDYALASLHSEWTFAPHDAPSWVAGVDLAQESAHLAYARHEQFYGDIAAHYSLRPLVDVVANEAPRYAAFGLYAVTRRNWRKLELELGMRLDSERYRGFTLQRQSSPRVNLRYDPAATWHVYGSWGHFVQPQRADEWRSESNQRMPDTATRATHLIIGAAHDSTGGLHWRAEAYRNHWSALSPYFDNAFDAVALLPELEPDRLSIAPADAEATGMEFSVRRVLGFGASVWVNYALSEVTDDLAARDYLRSWDQRHSATLGLAWQRSGTSVSLLSGWHTGWPRTPYSAVLTPARGSAPLAFASRNSARWGDYYNTDFRIARTLWRRHGDLTLWLDAVNLFNQSNACCIDLGAAVTRPGDLAATVRFWQPRVFNFGFTWELHNK
jgi:hypothetical protein